MTVKDQAENKVALIKQNSNELCKCSNKLEKGQGLEVSVLVNKLSLAKNIKLMDGTLAVWLECLDEDLANYVFDYDDFLLAIKDNIRETVYNRLDYANLYKTARDKTHNRRKLLYYYCPICGSALSVMGGMRSYTCKSCMSDKDYMEKLLKIYPYFMAFWDEITRICREEYNKGR